MSLLADTAEAVKEALNAEAFLPTFTAARGYQPEFELREMDNLHVTVVPGNLEEEPLDRNCTMFRPRVDVAVQQRIDPGDVASIDALMDLVQEIAAALRGGTLTLAGGATARWAGAEWSTPYAPAELKSRHLFVAVLTLVYEVIR